jgi:dephospho-CoA kinase
MRSPVIVVTGGIASGKTTVAAVIAARGGTLIDCDALARGSLAHDAVKRRIVREFGEGVLTRSGNVSNARLGRIVFASDGALARLNEIVRPRVTRIISDEVKRLRGVAPYIVLDAVLFFHYTFKFKVDLTIVTEAPKKVRLERLMKRDGLTREEALARIERQRYLAAGWCGADLNVRTDSPRHAVRLAAERIRDEFLEMRGISEGGRE